MNTPLAAVIVEDALASDNGPSPSAVSWTAIVAGTVVATALALVLFTLGSGLSFGATSVWPHAGATATSLTAMAAAGLVVTQWLSAGVGGYVTGRLRIRWAQLHTHEVFFRDTAHGLITWALATLLVAATGALIAISGASAAGHAAVAVASNTSVTVDPYDVDTLLRPMASDSQTNFAPAPPDVRAEVSRLLSADLAQDATPAADKVYLTQLVSAQAHVGAAEAQNRVEAVVAKLETRKQQALQAAEEARKAARSAAVVTALAMLVGAFIASVAATLGGMRRDVHS